MATKKAKSTKKTTKKVAKKPAKKKAAKKAPKKKAPAKKKATKKKAPAKKKATKKKAPAKKKATKKKAPAKKKATKKKAPAKKKATKKKAPAKKKATKKAASKKAPVKKAVAKRPRAKARDPKKPAVEELYFRSDSAYLCVILNRRTRFVRVVDFRAGALPAKRLYIQSVAQREGIAKVITLVEKDEVSSWTRVGFVREGTIPGFYKRSDGHLCGCVIGDRVTSVSVSDRDARLADRTIAHAKKRLGEIPDKVRGVTVAEVSEAEALKARDAAWKKHVTLSSFDAFGRDASRMYFRTSSKKASTNYLSAEYQDCFGHSLVEMLHRPKNEHETQAAADGLRTMCETLMERGIVSAFSFAPSDDVDLSLLYLSCGFRKTGLLAAGHLGEDDERRDAILWTKKLRSLDE